MEGTCRYVSIKTTTDKNCKVGYFEAGKSYNDPGINCGKVRREKQGLKPLFRTSFLLATFSVALGQHRRSCSTVIHFSPHSFTLLCLLSVLACHHDQTGPRLFFFLRGRLRCVLGSTMNYLFVRFIGRNTFEFRWMSSIFHAARPPFVPLPFRARVARTKIRISWLLALSGKKNPEEVGNALSP